MKFLYSLLTLLCCTGLALAQAPTNNPVEDLYPGQYGWTNDLAWATVFDITTYGGAGDSLTDNLAAFNLARDAAFAAGGGVVYFPPGVYVFSDHIFLRQGVVLRGATPANTVAHDPSFELPSRLVFPKYEFVKAGNGTPDSTAFKTIRSMSPNTDGNLGLVYLDVNRATIYFATKFGAQRYIDAAKNYIGTNKNILILGIRSNNAAVIRDTAIVQNGLGANVPTGQQNGWQRMPNRFIGNLNIEVSENCLIANSRFNDRITDDFSQSGYKLSSGTVVGDTAGTWFRYSDKSAIFLNTQMPDLTYWAADSAKAPFWFRPGNVVRDNWIYRTKRDGIQASGNGLLIKNNIVEDNPVKSLALSPTGTGIGQGFDYNGNRSIWIRGGNNVVVEDNRVTGHQQRSGNYASNDGEGIVADNQGSIINGLLVRNNDITCNWAGVYDVPMLQNILYIKNTVRPNNTSSQVGMLLVSKLGGYEGRNWCKTCIMDSNDIVRTGPARGINWDLESSPNLYIMNNRQVSPTGTIMTGGFIKVTSRETAPPRSLPLVEVYEGCNQGLTADPSSSVVWLAPPSCINSVLDSVQTQIVIASNLLPAAFGTGQRVSFSVYPNPAQREINLGFATQHYGLKQWEILAADGRSIRQSANPSKTISLDGMASGPYVLRVQLGNGSWASTRLIKR